MQRNFIFNGGYSTRYHTIDVHTRQDIGSHSFGVAWFCELLTEGKASKNLIMAALAHDLAEHIVGDIPSPAKRALKIGAMYDIIEQTHLDDAGIGHYAGSLTADDLVILKFADMMEGMMFCIRERKFGNRNVEIIFGRFRSYVDEVLNRNLSMVTDKIVTTFMEIDREWKDLINDTSKRETSSRDTLQSVNSALGLGAKDTACVSSCTGNEVSDPLEKKERGAGS